MFTKTITKFQEAISNKDLAQTESIYLMLRYSPDLSQGNNYFDVLMAVLTYINLLIETENNIEAAEAIVYTQLQDKLFQSLKIEQQQEFLFGLVACYQESKTIDLM